MLISTVAAGSMQALNFIDSVDSLMTGILLMRQRRSCLAY